ncbi:MAG TPA: hypothetical protein VF171_00470 [Trueperaceae bacterium]
MAHIPMDDVNQLWNETSGHDWSALHDTLERHKGKAQGIDNTLVQDMLKATDTLKNEGRPYPDSPQKLHDVLESQVS